MVDDAAKAPLRAAVIEAARLGYRPAKKKKQKNPYYCPPSKAGAAWSHLYGTCRALAEWATDENLILAKNGLAERTDSQLANIASVHNAAKILNAALERIKV